MIEIDGSLGEGGGQILRTALSLSCVLGEPVRIFNIRAGRQNPGLSYQHLGVCSLLSKIAGAEVKGAYLGSKEIEFKPSEISGGSYFFDIGTAGSCVLFLQAALPVLLHAKKASVLAVRGGTHVEGAPTYEYFNNVFLPAAGKFGARCASNIRSFGFYPKGGGEIVLEAFPSRLSGCSIEPQQGMSAEYLIVSSFLPQEVAKKEEETILSQVRGSIKGKIMQVPASCPGNAVTIWSGTAGGCAVGRKGKPASSVAIQAAESFLSAAGFSVDKHLADQLLLYAALSEGESSFLAPQFTMHAKTNAEIICRMTGRNIIFGSKGKIEIA